MPHFWTAAPPSATRRTFQPPFTLPSLLLIFVPVLLLTPTSLTLAQQSLGIGPNPESITSGADGTYFVTLMGETRTEGDGNGRIVRVDGDQVTLFTSGMDDPKGIVMLGDVLVTADFKKVWKVDKEGRKEVLAGPEDFPYPPLYLNDVALATDGISVLVSDMGARDMAFDPNKQLWPLDSAEAKALPLAGRVYRITLDGKVSEVIAPHKQMPCPNGLNILKDGTLRVCDFFLGDVLERQGEGWKVLATGHRGGDGIGHDSKGRFYVSEVLSGKVFRYEADGSGRTELFSGLISAADLLVDEANQRLIVPDSKGGKLYFMPL